MTMSSFSSLVRVGPYDVVVHDVPVIRKFEVSKKMAYCDSRDDQGDYALQL